VSRFSELEKALARKGVRSPGGLAASIAAKKYGRRRLQKAARPTSRSVVFADTARAVAAMCVAGERGEDLGYFDSTQLLRFSRSQIEPMEVHHWRVELPVEPPTIEHTVCCWHESFCHLPWPG
jgi:hypothetical protein